MDSTTQIQPCTRTPRRDLSLASRIAVLDQIKDQPPNTSRRKLSEITGVPKSTIARLLQQENKLRQEWSTSEGQLGNRKRMRRGKIPDVEEALNQWFLKIKRRGRCVSDSMLKNKSEELAKELGHTEFKATDGWLFRWKSRRLIQYKSSLSEKSNTGSSIEEWKSTKLHELLQKYNIDDIYSASETSLFYRALPDNSLCYKQTKPTDHVTVLCCTNMSGSDKRKLLVVGKKTNPHSFNGLRRDSLPILYTANNKAWMNSSIFKQWIIKWNEELQIQSKKVILLIVSCSAHPCLVLENIHLEFLPGNTKLPMEMGIITNLKTLYRRKLINHIETDINKIDTSTVRSDFTLLEAVQFLSDSWREVSSKTIQNCFVQFGFKHPFLEIPNKEVFEMYFGNEFSCIDNSIQCYNENIEYDEEMADETVSKNEDREEFEPVTDEDAEKFIAGLRRYFMQEGNEESPVSALNICADFVHLQSFKRKGLLSTRKTNDSIMKEMETIYFPIKEEYDEDNKDEKYFESTSNARSYENNNLVAREEEMSSAKDIISVTNEENFPMCRVTSRYEADDLTNKIDRKDVSIRASDTSLKRCTDDVFTTGIKAGINMKEETNIKTEYLDVQEHQENSELNHSSELETRLYFK